MRQRHSLFHLSDRLVLYPEHVDLASAPDAVGQITQRLERHAAKTPWLSLTVGLRILSSRGGSRSRDRVDREAHRDRSAHALAPE